MQAFIPYQMRRRLAAILFVVTLLLLFRANASHAMPMTGHDGPEMGVQIDALDASAPAAPADPEADPHDPYTRWRVEVNSGCSYGDHNIDVPVNANPEDMDDISLTMTNFDVDYVDTSGYCEGGSEVDRVTINGSRFLGILRGANDQWSTNSWALKPADVIRGDNNIYIDTDATNTGCWCVGVGWVEIKALVGFHVLKVDPSNGEQGVPFDKSQLNIDITFNMDYDPATVTENSVYIFYRNQAGAQVKVPYTRVATGSSTILRLQPNANLKDGVKYQIIVTNGVKNTDGKELELGVASHFWTLLDLSGKNQYNQDKVDTLPIQVSRNNKFIPKKPAVYRVYLRWDKKTDVHLDWQLQEATFDVKLQVGATNLEERATVKRPDKFTVDERRRAANSVNFYYTPNATDTALVATVTQIPQKQSPPQTYSGNDAVQFEAKSPKIEYEFWNVRANTWAGSAVPDAAKTWGKNTIRQGATFTTDNFPVVSTDVQIKGDTVAFDNFTSTGTGSATSTCVNCRYGTCPPYTTGNESRWEWECTARKLWTLRGATATTNKYPWVSGMVLKAIVPSATGWQWTIPGGGRVFMIQYETSANAGTVAHEAVHAGGIGGHIDNITNVQGFRVSTKSNKTRVEDGYTITGGGGYNAEGSKALNNLMHTVVKPWLTQWIDDTHYKTLITFFQNLAAQALRLPTAPDATQYILLSGDILSDTEVLMMPAMILSHATFVPTYTTAPYSVQLYEGASLLSTTPFSPTFMNNGMHVTFPDTVTFGMNAAEGSMPYLSFVTSVAYVTGTDKIVIDHNGTPIATITRTPNAPSIAFDYPASGATLSGTQTISWTVSDDDGDDVYTFLQWSEDGGLNYYPLTDIVTGTQQYEMDTTRAQSTAQGKLKIVATDGLNTAEAVVAVTFDNAFGIEASNPAHGDSEIPHLQPVSVWFNSDMDPTQLISDEISLRCGAAWINGTFSYDSDTRMATFTPGERLPYNTYCNAYVEAGLENVMGQKLSQYSYVWKDNYDLYYHTSWQFKTGTDLDNPLIRSVYPLPQEENVPTNALVTVMFDENVRSTDITSQALYLVDASGGRVTGTWSYNNSSYAAFFRPGITLTTDSTYTATVTAAISDTQGNPLEAGRVWAFTTGEYASAGVRIIGDYRDWPVDQDGDGKYDKLVIEVAVEAALPGSNTYDFNAQLLDTEEEEVGWAGTSFYGSPGVYRVQLEFSGPEIRSHGLDGPYTLHNLHLYSAIDNSIYDTASRAYATHGYSVTDFAAVLTFGGLPDIELPFNDPTPVTVDLKQYAWHATEAVTQLNYLVVTVTDPQVATTLVSTGVIRITAPATWAGTAEIFARATDGVNIAVGSFLVQRHVETVNLPIILRNHNTSTTPDGAGDSYEPDDDYTQASPITTDGVAQSHNFHDAGDRDWVKFSAVAGGTYTIETINLGATDTVLYLVDTDGITQLAYDDDGGSGAASRIDFTFSAAGVFYAVVEDYWGDWGDNMTYDIYVSGP